jgi:iron complex outermembrane receptor protein
VIGPDGSLITTTDLVRRRTVDEVDGGWVPTLTRTEGDWTFTLRGELRLHDAHHYGQVTWAQYYPPDVPPDYSYYDYRVKKQVAAVSLGAAWNLSPLVTASAGLEYAYRSYKLYDDVMTGVNFTQPYNFLLPRLGAVVHLASDTDLYANVARGMREPNLDDIYDPEDYYSTYANLAPEDVWDWEVGVSTRRATWRGRANVFWMNFANEIVYAGALDENGVPIYGNGAQSIHRGVEVDASWDPSRLFGLDAMLTWSRNTFTHYQQYNFDGTVSVFDGNYLAGYPNVLAVLTARTDLGPVQLALTGKYVGRFYLDNTEDNNDDPAARQQPGYVPLVNPAFTVLNLTAQGQLPDSLTRSLGLSRLGLELRVNNLLNAKYTAFGYVDVEPLFIPAATRNFYVGLTLGL